MSLVRNPFTKAFPRGEGGSHVPRKCETDEGIWADEGIGPY